MTKRFVIPFATSGDKTVTPDATDPGGAISYSQGWPVAYQLPDTDPAYRPVGRQEMNGVLFDVTGAISEIQAQGIASWVQPAGLIPPYAINAYVRYNDLVWRSTVANNSDIPGTTANWVSVVVQPTITTGGTAAALTLTPNPAIPAYAATLRFPVRFSVATTPTSTINVSGKGVKNLTQYSAAGVKIPAVTAVGQISDIEYDGVDWVVLNPLPPVVPQANLAGIKGSRKNLKASATGLSSIVSITADEFCVSNVANEYLILRNVNVSINYAAAVGAGGLDAGVVAINTIYHNYIIYNPTTLAVAGIASLSAAGPALPAGFTSWGRVLGIKTDGLASKYPLAFNFYGYKGAFQVVAGSNSPNLPIVISGQFTAFTTQSLTSLLPSTATHATFAAGTTNGFVGFSPVGAFISTPGYGYLSISQPNGFPFAAGYNAAGPVPTTTGEINLKTLAVQYCSTSASAILQCMGWEES